MTLELTIGAIGILGSLTLGWFKVLQPMWIKRKEKKKKEYDILVSISEDIGYMKPRLERVYEEVSPNGEQSLKDQITRIDQNLHFHKGIHRATINAQGVAYWLSDRNGLCTEASQNLCHLIDRTEKEMINNNWISWIHANDRDRIITE